MPKKKVTKVTAGLTFRKVIADCNALWKVVRRRGTGVWLCEVVNEPVQIKGETYDGDYAGQQDVFQERDILAAVNMALLFESLSDSHDAFYKALVPDQVVHYSNGSNQFVRCKVVKTDQGNKLKPIALVGDWKHDLPRRMRDGSIYYPRYAQKIVQGGDDALMEPNASNIYECKSHSPRPDESDPSTLPPISLAVPDMTEAEAAEAALWRAVYDVQEAVRDGSGANEDPTKRLRTALKVCQKALAK